MKNKQKNIINDINQKMEDAAHQELDAYRLVLTDKRLIQKFARLSDYEKLYNAFLEKKTVGYNTDSLKKIVENLAVIEKEVLRITRTKNNHEKVYPMILEQVTQNKPQNAFAYTEFYKEIVPCFQNAKNLETLITCLPTTVEQPAFLTILTTYVKSNQQTMDEFTMTDRIVKASRLMKKKQNSLRFAADVNKIFYQEKTNKLKK